MAPNRGRNRAHDFDDILDSAPNDLDPEADDIPDDSSDSEGSSADDDARNGAREHYVDVEKSKLRKPKTSALGPHYRGSRIGRDDLVGEDDGDDPFGRGFEDESSDVEQDLGLGNGDDSEDEDMEDDTSGTDLSDESMDAAKPHAISAPATWDKGDMRNAISKDQKAVASSLAQATRTEAEQGRAVKKQKAAFDSLLGIRIKLQKALVGANTIVGMPDDELAAQREEARKAIEGAELATFRLFSSLNEMREELRAARTGEKRKRSKFTEVTLIEDLWSHVQSQEAAALPQRNRALKHLSDKVKNSTARQVKGVIDKSATEATIIDSLQETLSNRELLLKRAHTPRSCAPLQLSHSVNSDPKIYDDADFYGLLLKELLEQKSADSVAAANIDLDFSVKREAKTKKNVDTKASKGRKLRYTVHEKLQNFMAPEDRSTWSERQADELFGSLFGRRMELTEGTEDDEMIDINGGAAEEGLMLFRN